MDQDQYSRAEQRMMAVAKLKRAASLPRMKDGRRPPMHIEAVSEGEKASTDDEKKDESPVPEEVVQDTVEPEPVLEQPERAVSASPTTRTKRRSRSRSRSRGSKDLKTKTRSPQSSTPVPPATEDSSPDEAPVVFLPPDVALRAMTPLLSPIPAQLVELQRSRLLRSPTPNSSDSPMLFPGTSPPTPLLPTLEALQRGLFRSNSAGGSAANRMLAMHKLTGGTEGYDPLLSPTPSNLASKLSRNNTVAGGERVAARQLMFSRLGTRVTKETEGESANANAEEAGPQGKRRRRRSRRGSQNATANTAASDFEFSSNSANTPIVPPTPLPISADAYAELRAQSTTPFQASNIPSQDFNPEAMPQQVSEDSKSTEPDRPETVRRRSVVVEESEDSDDSDEGEDSYSPQAHSGLPPPSQRSHPASGLRIPHISDAPSHMSTDSAASQPGVTVPVFLSDRSVPGKDPFPISPFATPSKEVLARDDDEQVLYPADTFRTRTPYQEPSEREISWVASLVPEIRMPIDEDDEDSADAAEEAEYEDSPSRGSSSAPENEALDDTSPRVSSDSKSLMLESETSPEPTAPSASLSSSVTPLSNPASTIRVSDGSSSPQTYPARLSVASRSPLAGEFPDWEANGDSSTKRSGDLTSAWEKVKGAFSRSNSSSGRRSRTNSIVNRERHSSVSRESGASLNSAKTDKGDTNVTLAQQQQQYPMQSPSASASILSLAPHIPAAGGTSPIPPASSADLSKYQNAKLFPFPGMKKLEEDLKRSKGIPTASVSSPDIMLGNNDNDQPPLSATSSNAHSSELPRDRKLSHQASDTRLVTKFNAISSAPSTNATFTPITPSTPTPNGSSLNLKLPMTLPGVKQWLSKNNKKIFSSQSTSSIPTPTSSIPAVEIRPPQITKKKPSLSDLLKRKDAELGADWEDLGLTPTSATSTNGDASSFHHSSGTSESKEILREESSTNSSVPPRSDLTDTEKTPKAKKVAPLSDLHGEKPIQYFNDASTALHSQTEQLSSVTPDPSSSTSDYPAHSTSESSSSTSSHESASHARPQGAFVLERLDENLRSLKSPVWAPIIDEPSRKLLLSSPVLQVVNPHTVKDRFLLLFSDILVIAKPVFQDQDSTDLVKHSLRDRKFVVKSVVPLHQLRFSPERMGPQAKALGASGQRSPILQAFIRDFPKDADRAISNLYSKAGLADDPALLGQLMFNLFELDRAQLGEHLSRRSSRCKSALKAYLDSFGFVGLRIDRALRVFLLSINIPQRSSHNAHCLEYLLDSFASRWYEANARFVAFDKDVAFRLVRAIVQLNELLHGGIAQEPGPTGDPVQDITGRIFVDAFRRYDVRGSVPDELLEDIYDSVRQERLSQARTVTPSSAADIPITIKRQVPARLTYKIQSEPIILRIPQPDPNLTIELYGQDLAFDPPTLSFAKSTEASFRVIGSSLGAKSVIMRRAGPNALKYSGLPLCNTLTVERAFMRYTFQLAFLDQSGAKRRYMFGVDDSIVRHQWVVSLKQQIDTAMSAPRVSPSASKVHRAAESLAFRVLQETLMGPSSVPPPLDSRRRRNNGHVPNSPGGNGLNGYAITPLHVRSKSRSRIYHRHGAGRNELDLNSSISNAISEGVDADADRDPDQSGRSDGPSWSFRELELQCQHNSSIVPVLLQLQIGIVEQEVYGNS